MYSEFQTGKETIHSHSSHYWKASHVLMLYHFTPLLRSSAAKLQKTITLSQFMDSSLTTQLDDI